MHHLDGRHADSRVDARRWQKPHQRTRKHVEKTKTVTVKKRPCVDALDSSDDFEWMTDLGQYMFHSFSMVFLLAAEWTSL